MLILANNKENESMLKNNFPICMIQSNNHTIYKSQNYE